MLHIHHPGIKLVDFDGGMLSQSWEPYAELLANCSDFSFSEELAKVAAAENIDIARRTDAVVVIGRDTRPHSLELSNCVRQGVEAFGGTVHDLGEIARGSIAAVGGDRVQGFGSVGDSQRGCLRLEQALSCTY